MKIKTNRPLLEFPKSTPQFFKNLESFKPSHFLLWNYKMFQIFLFYLLQ